MAINTCVGNGILVRSCPLVLGVVMTRKKTLKPF